MNSHFLDLKNEFQLLLASAEIRAISDNVGRAAFILQNYCGDLKFSLTELCSFFNIGRPALKARIISLCLGYIKHDKKKPRYLAPIHEQRLAEILGSKQGKHKTAIFDELPLIVFYA